MDPDFQQLSNDADLIARIKQFREAGEAIANVLEPLDNQEFYDKLDNSDKIKYNLVMSFGLNALFWMYLRTEGIDPSSHRIKSENDRLKKSMARAQRIKDKKTKMPRLNKEAARRFVRSGLWTSDRETAPASLETAEDDWDAPSSAVATQNQEPDSTVS